MFSLNFIFFCSLIEELCTKEENHKTGCNFNFGHECRLSLAMRYFDNLLSTKKYLHYAKIDDTVSQPPDLQKQILQKLFRKISQKTFSFISFQKLTSLFMP